MKFRINIDDQHYLVEIADINVRPIIATVDGQSYEVWPENETTRIQQAPDQAAGKTEIARPAVTTAPVIARPVFEDKVVRAPIPGVVVNVLVKPGDLVEHGQTLLSIEAMKMRNAIRSSRNGEVGKVFVAVGQTVNHNDSLVEFVE